MYFIHLELALSIFNRENKFLSSTYEDIQEKADQIWKYQRFKLVLEYNESSLFPPPLNYIEYLFEFIVFIKNKALKIKVEKVEGK